MADIKFFAADSDLDAIWGMVLEDLGMVAQPSTWFAELPIPALISRTDVKHNLGAYPSVAPGLGYFLTSSEWSQEPLEYGFCKDNPNFKPFWYVKQRYGGPSIHFIPRFGYPQHQEPHQLVSGMFSDYPYYFSVTDQRQIIERPASLASAMKKLRKGLRAHGNIVQSQSGQRAIAMTDALAMHARGVVLREGDIVYFPPSSGR